MINGKTIAFFLLAVAVVAGASMYYLQVYAFYTAASLQDGDLMLVDLGDGNPHPIPAARIEAIDATSSPLRFRACFDTPLSRQTLDDKYQTYPEADPLNAPGWFSCFDAAAIGKALKDGSATAYLSRKNVAYGVDRVIAVQDDGSAYAWHQLNHCGETNYDGTQVGEACPPRDAAAQESQN